MIFNVNNLDEHYPSVSVDADNQDDAIKKAKAYIKKDKAKLGKVKNGEDQSDPVPVEQPFSYANTPVNDQKQLNTSVKDTVIETATQVEEETK